MKKKLSGSLKIRNIAKLLIVSLVILSLGALGFYVNFLRRDNAQLQTAHLGNMIMDAAQNLRQPLPIDAQTGKVYIYEVKLMLPAQGPDTKMEYSYDKPINPTDYDEELRLTDVASYRSSSAGIRNAQTLGQLFAAAPHFQACNRGYLVRFKPNYATETVPLLFTKKIKDGRTVYVYLENECQDSKSRIEPYLKQIDSY